MANGIPDNVGATFYIHFLNEYVEACRRVGNRVHDIEDKFCDAVLELPGVDEICINHQVWIKFEPETREWPAIQDELEQTYARLIELLGRHYASR